MSRTRIYQVITLIIPFVFFALLEGGLRLFDYGQEISLFIDYPATKQQLHAPK
jgi:hypothetical protein